MPIQYKNKRPNLFIQVTYISDIKKPHLSGYFILSCKT